MFYNVQRLSPYKFNPEFLINISQRSRGSAGSGIKRDHQECAECEECNISGECYSLDEVWDGLRCHNGRIHLGRLGVMCVTSGLRYGLKKTGEKEQV